MANASTRRKFSWQVPTIAAVLTVGVVYVISQNMAEKKPEAPAPATGAAAAKPPAPPKVEFLSATAPTDLDDNGQAAAALGTDDAVVLWMKVTPAGGQELDRSSMPQLSLKDKEGHDYAVAPRPAGHNSVALHVKRGYPGEPKDLKLVAKVRNNSIGEWNVASLPPAKLVLDPSKVQADPSGVVNLQPGRRGQLGAVLNLKPTLAAGQGMILKPISATYTAIDSSRMRAPMMIKPGEKEFQSRVPVPNPTMAKHVAFEAVTFAGAKSVETATFKTARLEDRFGQPCLVVDADETVTTSAGHKATLPAQKDGPYRKPRHIHPEVNVHVEFDAKPLVVPDLKGVQPSVVTELVSPLSESLGLASFHIMPSILMEEGQNVFDASLPATKTGKAGTFKLGPIPALTFRFTVIQPKVVSRRQMVLRVDPKPLPAPAEQTGRAGGRTGV